MSERTDETTGDTQIKTQEWQSEMERAGKHSDNIQHVPNKIPN